jgi:hypothetical protein
MVSVATASESSSELLHITASLAVASGCGAGCPGFLAHWQLFWRNHAAPTAPPVAIMTCRDYYDRLRKKSKAMVRQANRNYTYCQFQIDEHAAAVHAVNHSKNATSEGPLRGWLAGSVQPVPDTFHNLCPIHQDLWFGGFDHDQTLRGYLRLVRTDTLGIIYFIFKHAENSTGVLNGLLAYVAEHSGVEHASYHTLYALPDSGRPAFKQRTGFQEARITIAC